MKLKLFLSAIMALCLHGYVNADYTITNTTNYPAAVNVTLICKYEDGHYSENTIDLNFTPKEAKNVPQSCRMKSMSAMVDINGNKVSTGVFSGDFYTGQSSGLLPSWEIAASTEGQYSGLQPFIRMAP